MKKLVVGVVLLIVFVILVFLLVGNSAGDLISAADSVTDANNCSSHSNIVSGETAIYNFTDKFCYEGNSSGQKMYLAGQFDLPLNTLFGRSSVLLLVFMAVILLVALFTVLKGLKDKK